MFQNFKNKLLSTRDNTKILISLSKGIIAQSRSVCVDNDPSTWEYSCFSQNGEDGVLDFLISKIHHPNYKLLELGCSDGLENNSTWQIVTKKYSGLAIDINAKYIERAMRNIGPYSLAFKYLCHQVTPNSKDFIFNNLNCLEPDIFSIDIDSYDFEVCKNLFESSFRPSIVVCEFNSAFGPQDSIYTNYEKYLKNRRNIPSEYLSIIYGCSFQAWQKFFEKYNYTLIHVNYSGVNLFFVNKNKFDFYFLNNIIKPIFRDNIIQFSKTNLNPENQYNIIKYINNKYDIFSVLD